MSDIIRINTPESVDLAFEPVGVGSRFVAAFVDALIQGAVIGLLALMMLPTSLLGALRFRTAENIVFAILFLLIGLLLGGYKLLFEAIWNGQTPGKRAAGIRVVRTNGLPVRFPQVLIRNLMRVVDYLPAWYLLGTICVLASQQNQRLGDMAAGTVVVRDRKATVPVVPTTLNRAATCDLDQLREHVRRLHEGQLTPVRGFLERRTLLDKAHRTRLAHSLANSLATQMGWNEPLLHEELFLEEVLFVRAQ